MTDQGFVYVNGNYIPRADATVSVLDRSFLYGDGLFETVRAYGGRPFKLADHVARLERSAAELTMPLPPRGEIERAVAELLARNNLADAYIRITVTRGLHDGTLWSVASAPSLVIDARPLHAYPDELFDSGAKVVIASVRHDGSPLRRHKTTSYILSILARRDAHQRGADEALLLDANGFITEGSVSNVFWLRGGAVCTTPLEMNILPGIARATVLSLAKDAGMKTAERRAKITELQSADEVFLTNSLMELMPVALVDGKAPRHSPGPVTQALRSAYRRLAEPAPQ